MRALSFEVGSAKPEAAHFEAALALAGAQAGNALYVDDRPELVAAAKSLGIDAFVVSRPEDLGGELQRMGLLSRETARRFSGGASPLFVKGLEEFRAGRFFEAHEEWERLWRASAGDDRVFLQGLIQVAAARVHIGRGNPASAARLLALAKEKLDRFGDEEGGMNLGLLRKEMEAALALPTADLLRRQVFTF